MKNAFFLLVLLIGNNLSAQELPKKLMKALKQNPILKKVINNKETYNLQLVYTQINRNSDSVPTFKTYYYGVSPETYFYPASTIKLPVALLALEKLNKIGIERDSPLKLPTEHNKNATIENYIKKVLLVSDNDAYNRLYEFLGPEEINEALKDKGFNDTYIVHKLEQNLTNNSRAELSFGKEVKAPELPDYVNSELYGVTEWVSDYSQEKYTTAKNYTHNKNIKIGKAYFKNGKKVNEPFDFSKKNRFGIIDQHRLLKNLMFPDNKPLFNLKKQDYEFVLEYMSKLPQQSEFKEYQSTEYYPSYVKFIQFGDKKTAIPEEFKIYNKIGMAYGFLTDNTYIVNKKTKVEYLITVSLLVNNNQTFNDDTYEYDTIGLPFMGELGRTIYSYYLNQK